MINPRELEILNILWSSEEPLTSTQISIAGKGLSQSTIQAVLRKLLKAGLVEVTGVTYSGNVLSRTYKPTESSRETILEHFTEDYKMFNKIISKNTLMSALLRIDDDPKRRDKEISELKEMLDNFKAEK